MFYQSSVFVVDAQRQPQEPLHPGRARYLLRAGRAAVLRRFPFTLILSDLDDRQQLTDASPAANVAAPNPARPTSSATSATSAPLRLKLDPGSKTTGLAVVNETTGQVVWAAELTHRGDQVQERLAQRRVCRRSRRHRHTRYRPARFENRRRRGDGCHPR